MTSVEERESDSTSTENVQITKGGSESGGKGK